ncbi:endonuclease V [Marinicellulosiphila megalodicopiae]|uniref:endonuclease V n=1 Tax=Marinicellulosiphila megalodicopiae TaxID=2724896 RepID=UPI003BAFEA92
MILAVDVDYKNSKAVIAGVTFNEWTDEIESDVFTSVINDIEEYEPGNFYRRELPCILQLLKEHKLNPDVIVVDGFVWLDGSTKAGLGAHLFDALDKKIPIIGVAKRRFDGITSKFELLRGDSVKPLYVTCVGVELDYSITSIANMAGKNRHPVLLKKADRLCRDTMQETVSEM